MLDLLKIMTANNFYHIYNRANGKEKLFLSNENYLYFMKQFAKYIAPIADVYAYCLIVNHFHFVIEIKNEEELNEFFKEKRNLQGFQNLGGLLSQQFSNFFNSYTKAFNKMHNRKGSLFSPNFKRKLITEKEYLQQVILYVHLNPVKHQITKNFEAYPYSSYSSMLSEKPSLIRRREVIELFDDKDNFEFVHQEQKVKTVLINEIVIIDKD